MLEPLFEVLVNRDDYPPPAVGDREMDEELSSIVVTEVRPEVPDQWRVKHGPAEPPRTKKPAGVWAGSLLTGISGQRLAWRAGVLASRCPKQHGRCELPLWS